MSNKALSRTYLVQYCKWREVTNVLKAIFSRPSKNMLFSAFSK